MSRAIRRRQSSAPKDAAAVKSPLGPRRPQTSRGARPPAQARRRFRLKQPTWLEDIISELKKVSWPSRDETIYLTTVVIIVSVAVGTALGLIDIFFNWMIDRILLR